ncbi:alpha/beta fold hydrolase [Tundrisphaera sp. TA3]|uniref:alpha/beta fold hydrolase n=1 Tax=Tundrisphaera sp. TA3 TaxID=3435775 RepID=UPI003EBE06B0
MTETASLPASFLEGVAEYDRRTSVGDWAGPHYRMTYRTLGEGPPLVVVPGLASTYRGYAPMLNRLASRFRTVVIDYPGENPDDGARLGSIGHDDLVDDLAGLCDHLGLDRPILFGLSFGSTITLRSLLRHPGRYAPVAVLQGGFARRGLAPHERAALALGRRIRGPSSRLPFHERALAHRSRSEFAGMDDRWRFYVEQNGLTPIAALSARLDLIHRLDLRTSLPQVRAAVLLIRGTGDRIVPERCQADLRAGLPNAEERIMVGAGHQPHFTHPEELADLVSDFVERAGSVPGG